jgi:HEAT repeat protein
MKTATTKSIGALARLPCWLVIGLAAWSAPILAAGGPNSPDAVGSVDDWIKRLQGDDPRDVTAAAFALGGVHWDNETDTQALLRGLAHPSPRVRRYVAMALGELDLDASRTVPALVGALKDADRLVREHALVGLVKIGAPSAPALARLLGVEDIVDPTPIGTHGQTSIFLSDYAAYALSEIGPAAIPALVNEYRDGGDRRFEGQQRLYVRIIGAYDRTAVPALVSLLSDKDDWVSTLALLSLGELGHLASDAVAPVLAVARDGRLRTAVSAISVLARIGPKAAPALLELLDDGRGEVRAAALDSVGVSAALHESRTSPPSDGSAGGPAWGRNRRPSRRFRKRLFVFWPEFAANSPRRVFERSTALKVAGMMTRDPEPKVRTAAAGLYVFTEPGCSAEIKALVEVLLRDPDQSVRTAAARALNAQRRAPSDDAASLLPGLLEALRKPDAECQAAAAVTLGNLGSAAKSALPTLLGALKTPPDYPIAPRNRFHEDPLPAIIEAIGRIGTDDPEIVGRFLALLGDESQSRLHDSLSRGLLALGPAAAPAVPALIERSRKRISALSYPPEFLGLHRIGPEGLAALARVMEDPSADLLTRRLACRALTRANPKPPEVVAALTRMLEAPEAGLKWAAACSLASSRQEVSRVVPVLTEAWRATGRWDRTTVARAFGDLGPGSWDALFDGLQAADRNVRIATFEALVELAPDDPRLTAALIRALEAPEPTLRSSAARLLGEVRPADAGPAVLALMGLLDREALVGADYRTSVTVPQNDSSRTETREVPVLDAFATLRELGPRSSPAAAGLKTLMSRDLPLIRSNTLAALAAIGPEARSAASEILAALFDRDADVRIAAIKAVDAVGVDLGKLRPDYVEQSVNHYIRARTMRFFDDLADALRPTGDHAGTSAALPQFPWPPPRWTHVAVFGQDIPRDLLGDDGTTLFQVHQRLFRALIGVDPNFESGLFGVPDGFVLLAKMERTQEDGTPFPKEYRWTRDKVPPLSLSDYVGRLFYERPGYFRVLAFVVTPQVVTGFGPGEVPDLSLGAPSLPQELGRAPLKGMNAYVMVYSYRRERGGNAEPLRSSGLSALTHLTKSGVLAILQQR